MKQKVLIITNHYLDNLAGGTIASLAYINAFASLYPDCSLIYPDNGNVVSHLLLPSIKTFPCVDIRSRIQKGFEIYFGKIHRFGKCSSNAFLSLRPDIVVFDTSIVTYRLIKLAKKLGTIKIIIHHNVEQDYLNDNPPSIAYRFAYWNYLVRAEREGIRNSDLNLTLTESDRLRLISIYDPNKIYLFKKTGVFEPYKYPSMPLIRTESERNSLKIKFVISGNLSFSQSDLSIREFVKTLWPVISSCNQDYQLIITGRNPTRELLSLCNKYQEIKIISDTENYYKIIAESDYYICPVDRGSGFKFRIMDGLRIGLPAIVHEVSARGYEPFISSGDMIVYNSEESLKKAIYRLMNTKFDRNKIQKIYAEFFSLKNGINRVKNTLEESIH